MDDLTFPDTVAGVLHTIGVARPDVLVGKYLPATFMDELPAATARRLPSPGGPEPFLRTDRVVVDLYAVGSTAAEKLGQDVRAALADTWHDTPAGLLDRVEVETEPSEVPAGGDTASYVTLTLRVDVRAGH